MLSFNIYVTEMYIEPRLPAGWCIGFQFLHLWKQLSRSVTTRPLRAFSNYRLVFCYLPLLSCVYGKM